MNFNIFKLSVLTVTVLSLSWFIHPSYAANSTVTESNKEKNMLVWLSTIDKNEIAAGKIALKNSSNADVKSYAEEMINDHEKNLKETNTLMKQVGGKHHSDSTIKELADKGKKEEKALKHLKGKDFDKAYMNAMVNGHTEALDTLGKDLANLESSSKIEAHLKDTEAAVSAHLEKAKLIQSKLS